MLDKRISESKKLALVSDKAKVVYFMLLPHLDKYGGFKAVPELIRWTCMPNLDYTYKDVEKCLGELDKAKLIILHNSNGDIYLHYIKFRDFQTNKAESEGKTDIPVPSTELLRTYYEPTTNLLRTQVEGKVEGKGEGKEIEPFLKHSLETWNKLCDEHSTLTKIRSITPTRKTHLKERYKNKDFVDNWLNILEGIKTTPFLLGKNDRNWSVCFDFITKNDDNYQKILEGKYKNKGDDNVRKYRA